MTLLRGFIKRKRHISLLCLPADAQASGLDVSAQAQAAGMPHALGQLFDELGDGLALGGATGEVVSKLRAQRVERGGRTGAGEPRGRPPPWPLLRGAGARA